ncbi:hypothetical protein TGS27_2405 [Geobacillus stearothermophilus]|nr:hypothetical protein TGS27_2405 [Geobacillus stearothermophilus]
MLCSEERTAALWQPFKRKRVSSCWNRGHPLLCGRANETGIRSPVFAVSGKRVKRP